LLLPHTCCFATLCGLRTPHTATPPATHGWHRAHHAHGWVTLGLPGLPCTGLHYRTTAAPPPVHTAYGSAPLVARGSSFCLPQHGCRWRRAAHTAAGTATVPAAPLLPTPAAPPPYSCCTGFWLQEHLPPPPLLPWFPFPSFTHLCLCHACTCTHFPHLLLPRCLP